MSILDRFRLDGKVAIITGIVLPVDGGLLTT
jgi:hypothetical protein